MTISSSLNAGVMGLNANATRLATISDNIANSATYGYKRADVEFSSLVINQRPSVYSAGGVTGIQSRDISDPGTLTATGRATDISVDGVGMLPVTRLSELDQPVTDREFLMMPTGRFTADANGYLRTESGNVLLGWPVDTDGIAINNGRATSSSLVPVNISEGAYTAEVTDSIRMGINLPGDPAQLPANNTLEFPIEYYDQIGLAQSMDVSFTRDPGTGVWTAIVNDNSTGAPVQALTFDMTFNQDGTLDTVTPGGGATYNGTAGTITMTLPSGPVEVFVGTQGSTAGINQVGLSFQTQNVTVNGSPAGELQSVEFTSNGDLEAIYNSGARRTIFKVPVSVVTNPNGLEAVDNQSFRATRESGSIYLWDAGDGPSGTIAGYSLMESNTDIATELTNLIETQRAYSSNAKIVQTVDEMLQETTNLKR